MRRGVGLLVAVVLVLAATGVLAGLGVRHAQHANAQADERARIASLAGQYAVDFTSVDYRHLQADFQAAAMHATSAFAKEYLATVQVFVPLYTKGQVVQTTSVERAGIASLTATNAIVLVALKGIATNTKSKIGTQQLFRMQVSLEKVGNRWLTSKVTPL